MYTSLRDYFHLLTNILSFIFKYLFYLYLIYILYIFLNFYIHFDETFINNMIILSFDDFENLANNVNDPSLNNSSHTPINYNNLIDNLPKTIAGYGAYKVGMEVSKNVPSIGGKALIIASVGALAAGSITFGTLVGENLAEKFIKDNKNKLFFNMINSNNINLNLFPYNLLFSMSTINLSSISFLIIISNILIVEYINRQNINLLDYLPNFIKSSKLYNIINFILNKYINIWSITKTPFLIISIISLFLGLLINQLGLYLIINN